MGDRDFQVDPRELAYRQAYSDYTNHVMGCRDCYAPNGRYCAAGEPLHLEADARYMMTVPDRYSRARLLALDFKTRPAFAERLKSRVVELFDQAKEGGE